MYQFAATPQTSTATLPSLFQKIKNTVLSLRVNETKLTLRNAFNLDLFALRGKKDSKYDKRTLFLGSLQKPDLSVNPQPPKHAYTRFSGHFQFQAFFGVFLLFLDIKIKFVKFSTKFQVKQAKSLPPRCTSLLLCSKPVQQNYLYFFKNFKTQCGV